MDAQLKKGLLEVCVLSAIKKQESYGYKIISDLAPFVEISESTLYPILRRLESAGAVKTRSAEFNGRLRRYFSITPIGLSKIDGFIMAMESFERIKEFIIGGES